MRCTEFVTAVCTAKKSARSHLVDRIDRERAWTACGDCLPRGSAVLMHSVPVDEIECRTCKDAHLRAKRMTKPGWWAKEGER